MANVEVNPGDIAVTLQGKEFTLKCSLEAALALTKNNGLRGAVERCLAYDVDTIVDVYAIGLGKRSRALPKAIYDEGVAKCSIPAIRFLTNLSHGGKPPVVSDDKLVKDEREEADDDDGPLAGS